MGEALNETTDGFIDLHEQRRLRNEIDSAQKSLQKMTQLLQPLIHTFEFAADDFDAVLKELEDCRRQSKIVEQQLNEHLQKANSQTTKLNATLNALDSEILNIREKIAFTTATILRNEQKMSELIAAKPK
jgi:chromosome segregation ATPase